MTLSRRDARLLAGDEGPARQRAMSILLRLARVQGAERFIDITQAHIDGCILTGDALLRFAELFADDGGEVAVPTSTNIISVDRDRWAAQGVSEEWARKATRLGDAYLRMGARPTFTCSPYQGPNPPAFGEQIAWAESNAIAFANGALGARTNRYGDLIDLCAALTGRVPLSGFHLDEARLGTVLVELDPLHDLDDAFYPVLGYLVGAEAGADVPVVDGLDHRPTADNLKSFGAAAATSGAVGMFHIVGVTPEAPTRDAALGGRPPQRVRRVSAGDLRAAWRSLSTAAGGALDCVCFGSPHLSLDECRELARLVDGRRRAAHVDVVLTTSAMVFEAARRLGLVDVLERFGASFMTDTCVLNTPMLPQAAGMFMTNSAKYAHYAPGVLGRDVLFGSTEDCVRSATEGRPVSAPPRWLR